MQHLSWLITLELVLLSGSLVKGQKSCKDFAVGIKDKRIIPDTHMTASSSLSSQTRAYHARVKGKGEGWCAGKNRQGEFLEINVGKEYVLCGIALQRGSYGFVTSFTLQFSLDGHSFNQFPRILAGVSIQKEEEFYFLGPFPPGKVFRFFPENFVDNMCTRLELYGFPGPKVSCTPQNVIAEFKRDHYPDLKAEEMHLTNTSCLAETDTEDSNLIVFKIPLRGCGTVRKTPPGYLEYSNAIIRRITQGQITFKMDMTFPISCKYDRNVTVGDVDLNVKDTALLTARKCYICTGTENECSKDTLEGDQTTYGQDCPAGSNQCLRVWSKIGGATTVVNSCIDDTGCNTAKDTCNKNTDGECAVTCCNTDLCNAGASASFSMFLMAVFSVLVLALLN